MSVSPTGPDTVDVTTPIVADTWVEIANPNMSSLVNMTCTVNVYVAFQRAAPGAAEVTFPLWNMAYLSEKANDWFGYDANHDLITTIGAIWVRPITPGATGIVYSHFRRQ